MSIDVKCPQCGSELDVPDTAAGKKARCPDCGAVVAVPLPATDKEAADVLLAGDAGRAIAAAPAGAAVSRTPPPAEGSAPPPRRRRPVTGSSLLKPARNGPACFASTCALLSLVPGFALLFGPLALLLGFVGLVVGRFRGTARGTRDVVAALGLGLLTTAGNWGLVLYVVSVVGVPARIASRLHLGMEPAPGDVAVVEGDPIFGFDRGGDPANEDKVNPALRKSLAAAEPPVLAAAFSHDGKRVAMRRENAIELWDLETEQRRTIPAGREAGIGHGTLSFSPDGRWLAVVRQEDQADVALYDPDTGECRKTLALGGFALPDQSLAFSGDGSLLAVGHDHEVRLWRTAGWEELPTRLRGGFFFRAEALALSPDGSMLAVAADSFGGATILLWDTRQGKERARFRSQEHVVEAITFSPDGKQLAVTGWFGVTVVDVAKVAVTWEAEHAGPQPALAFSPGGRMMATSGVDHSLVVSDAVTGQRLAVVGRRWRHGRVLAARFSPDAATLLTASDAGVVETWDVAELLKRGPPR